MPVVPIVERKQEVRPLPAGRTGAQINAPQLRLPGPVNNGGLDSIARGQQAIAQGVRDIGGALFEIAQSEKSKADKSRILEAEEFLTRWEIENVHKGALQQRGKNAIGIASKVSQDYDIAANGFRENLANDSQKEAFDRLAVSRGLTIMRSMTTFEREQSRAVYKSQMESTVEAEKERALANVGNTNIYNNSARNAVAAFQVWAEGEGLPKETIDRQTDKIINDIHFGAAMQMASVEPDAFLDNVDGTRDIGTLSVSAYSARGIRNNNPGNLRKTKVQWKGENGADSEGFSTFESPQAGLRAMALNLVNQQRKHKLDTVTAIMSKYAPPSENDTNNYINFVAKRVGVKPNQKLDMEDPETLRKFSKAVIEMENGGNPFSDELVDGAVRKVLKVKKTGLAGDVPGLKVPGNIDLNSRTELALADGTPVTDAGYQFSFRGKNVIVPGVNEKGEQLSEEDAIAEFKKTGKHLGQLETAAAATDYAQRLTVSQQENRDQKQQALSNLQAFDSLTWEQQQKVITAANTLSERRRVREEREVKRLQEKNMFQLYSDITDPEKRQGITREQIIESVRNEDLTGEQGRKMVELLESDESVDDDLATFTELSRLEATGELKSEDIIDAHAAGNLKGSTAKSFISAITNGLNQNESYKSGKEIIEAQFDKSDFGIVQGDAAERRAESLREYQNRVGAGETANDVSKDIVDRLKQSAVSDRVYMRTLSEVRKSSGVSLNTPENLQKAFDKVQAAAARGDITKADAAQKINALSRRKQEIEDGGL